MFLSLMRSLRGDAFSLGSFSWQRRAFHWALVSLAVIFDRS
jgi:hypothetical protein